MTKSIHKNIKPKRGDKSNQNNRKKEVNTLLKRKNSAKPEKLTERNRRTNRNEGKENKSIRENTKIRKELCIKKSKR